MEDTKVEGTKTKKRSRNVKEVPTERLRTIPSVLFPVILQIYWVRGGDIEWICLVSINNQYIITWLTSLWSSPRRSRLSAKPWWRGGWPAAGPAGSPPSGWPAARAQARGHSAHSGRESRQPAWRSGSGSLPTLAIINSWIMRVITDTYKESAT